jgi:hypothetical protein
MFEHPHHVINRVAGNDTQPTKEKGGFFGLSRHPPLGKRKTGDTNVFP